MNNALARVLASWTEDVTDDNDFGKMMMDECTYGFATAIDFDEWLEEYRKLLQDAIPKFLYKWNNTTGAICLDSLHRDDFTTIVEIVNVAGKEEIPSDKCESPVFANG